jgi:hypothetical protein
VCARLSAGALELLPTLVSFSIFVSSQPKEGDAIIRWAAAFVKGGAGGVFLTYEQIHPHDPFGKVVKHL